MKLTYDTHDIAVFDDVLDAEAREALWTYVQLVDYRLVHHDRWHKDWRLLDGTVLRTPAVEYRGATQSVDASHYPTQTPIDRVLSAVVDGTERWEEIGRHGETWAKFRASVYLYPAGTGLSWHHDSPHLYSGSFIYYCHREWSSAWGGELMVQPEPEGGSDILLNGTVTETVRREGSLLDVKRTPIQPHLDDRNQTKVLSERGRGEFVMANPNRLVLIRAGVPHSVNRVSPAAGEHARVSVAGFFEK